MNTVLIIPTGLGAKIGGGCGDALPVAKLVGSMSDKLITHPNVVNGADINEMPNNTLYVEGSQLDRFLNGQLRYKCLKAPLCRILRGTILFQNFQLYKFSSNLIENRFSAP